MRSEVAGLEQRAAEREDVVHARESALVAAAAAAEAAAIEHETQMAAKDEALHTLRADFISLEGQLGGRVRQHRRERERADAAAELTRKYATELTSIRVEHEQTCADLLHRDAELRDAHEAAEQVGMNLHPPTHSPPTVSN